MEASDKIRVLLLVHDMFEFNSKPTNDESTGNKIYCAKLLLASDFNFISIHDILRESVKRYVGSGRP